MSSRNRPATKNSPAAATVALSAEMPWWREILAEPVALGLFPVILLRPFSDGPTYPTNNFYFIAAIMALLAVWGARMLFRGEPVRHSKPLLLLLAFWVVSIVTGFNTVQFDATYRTIIIWAGHLALFFLILNGVRSRTGIAIIVAAMMTALLLEAAWSLVHFRYVLPFVRDSVMNSPGLRKMYFGSTEIDPELIHRMEVNRAFGSLLFPNALAALLVVGVPYAAAGAIRAVRSLMRGEQKTPVAPSQCAPIAAVTAGGLAWFGSICVLYFFFTFVASFEMPLPRGFERGTFLPVVYSPEGAVRPDTGPYIFLWICFVVVLPLLAGVLSAYTTRKRGLAGFSLWLRAVIFPLAFVLMARALWLTYSRGAFLAMGAAVLFTAGALLLQRFRSGRLIRHAAVSFAALAAFSVLFSAYAEQAENASGPATAPPVARQAQGPPAHAPAQASQPSIRREGVNLTGADLMNPASFRLRLSYWKTGLVMARNNLLTGVGLGNFGTVYPKYQPLGAGDVRAAHNDYLQAFCETGLIGGTLFCAFWAYFVIWGILRLMRERDTMERVTLGGMYLGVLAFLLHSFLDFNFFNSALAFFAFLLAAVFYVRAGTSESPPEGKRKRSQLAAVPILIAAAAITGMLVPAFVSDFIIGGHNFLNVGDNKKINAIYDAGMFFFRGLSVANEPGKVARKDVDTIRKLIPGRKEVESFGILCVATDDPEKGRQLRPDEPVPQDAYVVVTNPRVARQRAQERADAFLKSLAVVDGIFPHNPEWAAYFVQWYDLLASTSTDPEQKQRYVIDFVRWAEEGVRRSPEQALFHEWYGKALWLRGNVEKGPGRKQYFEKGLAEYKTATELYPISPYLWHRYGEALVKYGQAVLEAGDRTTGEARIAEGKEAQRHAQELEESKGSA